MIDLDLLENKITRRRCHFAARGGVLHPASLPQWKQCTVHLPDTLALFSIFCKFLRLNAQKIIVTAAKFCLKPDGVEWHTYFQPSAASMSQALLADLWLAETCHKCWISLQLLFHPFSTFSIETIPPLSSQRPMKPASTVSRSKFPYEDYKKVLQALGHTVSYIKFVLHNYCGYRYFCCIRSRCLRSTSTL